MGRHLTVMAAIALIAAPHAAADPGGASAPASSVSGGARPTLQDSAPVARMTIGGPVHAGQAPPSVNLRFDARDEVVTARAVLLRGPGNSVVSRLALGTVRSGQDIPLRWPGALKLTAGRYVLRVHAADRRGRQLRRPAAYPGKATFSVGPAHEETSAPVATAPPAASGAGVFPVAGPVTYGEGFGAPRQGYSHQGQDMAAAQGTPVVAPRAGTVSVTDYQEAGAGEYTVMTTAAGESYVFAHCQRDSTAVRVGQVVSAGDTVCLVGSTGRSWGSHLHFEIWVDGWRTGPMSRPVDPLAQLKAWADARR